MIATKQCSTFKSIERTKEAFLSNAPLLSEYDDVCQAHAPSAIVPSTQSLEKEHNQLQSFSWHLLY